MTDWPALVTAGIISGAVCLLLHAAQLYGRYWWWDVVTHATGAVPVAVAALYVTDHWPATVGLVLLVAGAWEVFEVIAVNEVRSRDRAPNDSWARDTFSDLLVALCVTHTLLLLTL